MFLGNGFDLPRRIIDCTHFKNVHGLPHCVSFLDHVFKDFFHRVAPQANLCHPNRTSKLHIHITHPHTCFSSVCISFISPEIEPVYESFGEGYWLM